MSSHLKQQQQQQQQHVKKVQSLDEPTIRRSASKSRAPLLHSVSIVVELATDAAPDGRSSSPSDQRRAHEAGLLAARLGAPSDADGGGGGGAEEADADADADEDENQEEEDEECLLASGLARRVVIVDEADKIFRGRAQSAEPPASGQPAASLDDQRRCESVDAARPHQWLADQLEPISGGELAAASLATDQQQQQQVRWRHQSQNRNQRQARHSFACQSQSALKGSSALAFGGSSELAERGALARLGMRRNSHHQGPVGGAPLAPAHRRSPSGFASDLPLAAGPLADLQGPQADHQVAISGQRQQQTVRANQNRRQSLQFSLLASSAIACCHHQTSRSLTEEEVRGERQFNEQVRNIGAKSPLLGQELVLEPADKLQADRSPLGRDSQRRQTCASILGQAAGDSSQAQPIGQQQQQLASKRRVSFSSIDPISNRPVATPTTRPSEWQATTPSERTSVCATTRAQLELESSSTDLPGQRPGVKTCSSCRQTFGPSQLTTRTILKQQKRHSLATNTVQATCSLLEFANSAHKNNCKPNNQANERKTTPTLLETKPSGLGQFAVGVGVGVEPASGLSEGKNITSQVGPTMASLGCKKQADPEAAPLESDSRGPAGLVYELEIDGNRQQIMTNDSSSGAGAPMTTTTKRLASVDLSSGDTQQMSDANSSLPSSNKSNNNRLPPKHQSKSIGGSDRDENRVQSIMANARLRQEEFARLLEEHEQIVNEINRVETKFSNISQTTIGNTKQQPGTGT